MEKIDFQNIVEKYFDENSMEDCFFVDTKVTGNKIEIFIDRDGGVSYDICHKLSRCIEEVLDSTKAYGDNYTLDVSSPGIGNPLKLPRQYKNNIGRTIEIKLLDKKVKGLLFDANEDKCIVQEETVVKEGNKKKKLIINHDFKYVDIVEAKIKISF